MTLTEFLLARTDEGAAAQGFDSATVRAVVLAASEDERRRIALGFTDHPDYDEAWRP